MRKLSLLVAMASLAAAQADTPATKNVLHAKAAMGDRTTDAPGVRRLIKAEDLSPPYHTDSSGNGPENVERPD